VKWTAPEGLSEQGQFSEKSDVVCSIHSDKSRTDLGTLYVVSGFMFVHVSPFLSWILSAMLMTVNFFFSQVVIWCCVMGACDSSQSTVSGN